MTISTGPGAADVPDRDEGARAADVSDSPSTSTPQSAGGDGGTVQQAGPPPRKLAGSPGWRRGRHSRWPRRLARRPVIWSVS